MAPWRLLDQCGKMEIFVEIDWIIWESYNEAQAFFSFFLSLLLLLFSFCEPKERLLGVIYYIITISYIN